MTNTSFILLYISLKVDNTEFMIVSEYHSHMNYHECIKNKQWLYKWLLLILNNCHSLFVTIPNHTAKTQDNQNSA